MNQVFVLFKETVNEFRKTNIPQMAASLAYFSLFAIAPVLLLSVYFLQIFLSDAQVQFELLQEFEQYAAPDVVYTLGLVLTNMQHTFVSTRATNVLGIFILLAGSTTLFIQLQHSINLLWNIKPKQHSFLKKIHRRIIALLFVLISSIALFLLFFISLGIHIYGNIIVESTIFLQAITIGVSTFFLSIMFATIYKFVPDADIGWADAFVGSTITTMLFILGNQIITVYLSTRVIGTIYGTAGSLLILLLWLYYSAFIFLFGSVLTKVYAHKYGSGIHPD